MSNINIDNQMLSRGKGDPDFHGYPGQVEEPTTTDFAMSQLNSALIDLEKHGAAGYVVELKRARQRIQHIINNAVKPF